jgi:uncharacterized protein
MDISYPTVGFVVGVIVGLTGVGGGSLMTPLLVFVFHVSPLTAVGTDLLFAGLTKTVGVAAHSLRNQVEWWIVRRLLAGSLPAAVVSVYILSRLRAIGVSIETFLLPFLGIALLGTAVALVYMQRIRHAFPQRGPQNGRVTRTSQTVLVGALLGVLVSFTSVGAGALGVAALMVLYPKIAPAKIVGTDLAHAIPLVTVAGLGHLELGNVNYLLLLSLLVGSLPGIWLGTTLSSKLPEIYMRKILVGVLFTVGLVCIWR